MATFAVGDLQGNVRSLELLLDRIGFDAARDEVWFVGDLVNRGEYSLECLRLVRGLGNAARTVLGNHDLHLLCVAEGLVPARRSDTLSAILTAPDRDELLNWLRSRPLLHREGDWLMVHAGLLPQWTPDQAQSLAGEVQVALLGPDYRGFLAAMYGNSPSSWDDELAGYARLRVIVNALTRLRLCTAQGVMDFAAKGEPTHAPPGFMPWFDVPGRLSLGTKVVCGHWSALGLRLRQDLAALDSGCMWGRALSALRLEDGAVFQVPCVVRK